MQWKVIKYNTNKQPNFVGNFTTKLNDKLDGFNFCNANFPTHVAINLHHLHLVILSLS